MNALAAHKLRSALTLLGVLIGVFSIIVVMTAMRVLKRNIETELSQLGSQTFAIQRWPEAQFGDNSDWQKYWRRKNITLAQGRQVAGESHARRQRRHRRQFLARPDLDPLRQDARPPSSCSAKPPAAFPARNWDIDEGRALIGQRRGQRPRCLRARQRPGQNGLSLRLGRGRRDQNQRLSITPWSACSPPRAARSAATRTISPSSPSPRR